MNHATIWIRGPWHNDDKGRYLLSSEYREVKVAYQPNGNSLRPAAAAINDYLLAHGLCWDWISWRE